MLEAIVAFTFFDKVLAGLGLLREGQKERSQKTDEALLNLYVAISETKTYLNERKNGAARSEEREYAIARLWHKASVPLREIDPEFAERCFIKGGYWMEPAVWTDEQIKSKGIAIDQVLEHY